MKVAYAGEPGAFGEEVARMLPEAEPLPCASFAAVFAVVERGAAERGVDETTVAKVWDMILSFAGYSFCKPHSASYALVSFKSAYLRAHHPAEFMAAVVSNGGGYYSAFAYISECRRMGLKVLLPDVNESRREYTGRSAIPTGDAIFNASSGE